MTSLHRLASGPASWTPGGTGRCNRPVCPGSHLHRRSAVGVRTRRWQAGDLLPLPLLHRTASCTRLQQTTYINKPLLPRQHPSTSVASPGGPFYFAENIVNRFIYRDMFNSIPKGLFAFPKIKTSLFSSRWGATLLYSNIISGGDIFSRLDRTTWAVKAWPQRSPFF